MNSCILHNKKASMLALVVAMVILFGGIIGAAIGCVDVYEQTIVEATVVGSTEE